MASEQYPLATFAELAADISDVDMSLTIAGGANWPTVGQFRIFIDEELLLLEGGAGLTYTILERAAEGTTAAAHNRRAQCVAPLTPQGAYNLTGGVRLVTAATDTLKQTDRAGLVVYSRATAIAVTLPQAGAGDAAFGEHWWCSLLNLGVGTVTVTPTTSTINGNATRALTTGQSARVSSDGTNYYAELGAGTGGGSNALLDGSVHNDTVAQTVSRGSLVYGNSTPKWDELVIGAANALLGSDGTDVAWFGCTAAGRDILDDANAGAQRTTLGVGTGDSPQFAAVNVGHATDTTITRVSAGVIAVEGSTILVSGGALGTPSSGTLTNCTGLPQAGTVGLTTADSPQFAGVNVGHASDTTLTRVSAGVLAVEGNTIYAVGGTDVALADGGTGASLSDPNADRILFWDDSAGQVTWLTAGTGLTISGTTITVSSATVPDFPAVEARIWSASAGVILDTTTKSLEVLLAGAITTNQLPWVTSFAELASDSSTSGPKNSNGATNSTSAVTVLAAPGASLAHLLLSFSLYNADTVPAAATIRLNDNSTTRIIVKATLAVGDTLGYDSDGWYTQDSNGSRKLVIPNSTIYTADESTLHLSGTTFSIKSTYPGQSSITTVGTIGTGTWQGTKVGLAYGGTNADLSGTGGTSKVLKQTSSGAAITVSQVSDADLSVTDVTSNDVSTAAHGFAPKLPNNAAKFLNGTGAYTLPAWPGLNNGRLTLASATPVTTTDQLAKTTIYWTPYHGNSIALYDGTNWVRVDSAEVSVAVPSTTVTPFDVFGYLSSGALAIETLNWTNDTTRATALVTTTGGTYTKSGDATRLYLGTGRTTGSSGQCEDSNVKRFLWNFYNRTGRYLVKNVSTTTWTISSTTVRQMNADTANKVELVIGVNDQMVRAFIFAVCQTGSGDTYLAGVGIDSTTVNSAVTSQGAGAISRASEQFPTGLYYGWPAVGYHAINMLEALGVGSSATSVQGTQFGVSCTGMTVDIDC